MIEFISQSNNLPFAIALAVMIGIAILEGITALLGAGISGFLDTLVPEVDTDIDVDIDGSGINTPNYLTKLLGWLRIGKVPILMLLIIFLTAFGLLGLGIQTLTYNSMGFMLPAFIATIPAFLFSLPVVSFCGEILSRIMPKDETDAVSEETFIGRVAVITLGEAKSGSPAQAKLADQHGYTHYVMVEPDINSESFRKGDSILLVKKNGSTFKAISNSSLSLID